MAGINIAMTTNDIYTTHRELEEALKQCCSQSPIFSSIGVVVVFDGVVVFVVEVVVVFAVELVVVTSSAILIIALVSNVNVPPRDPVYVLVIVYVSDDTSEGMDIDTLAVAASNVSQLGIDDPFA